MSQNLIDTTKIPKEVTHVTQTLETGGFEAFLVGGCVRDLLMGRNPKDWDITTNANPEQIIALFPKTVYENTFGTVLVVFEDVTRVTMTVEVTPYRQESVYSDNRHPDSITFSKNIEDDLKRRDFTINAMAYSISKGHTIDLYKGQEDIRDNIVRAVGNASERFREDGLRLLRAIRFSTVLNFEIEKETEEALIENSHLLKNISFERIRDEFTKIVLSTEPMRGIKLLEKFNVLEYIVPELREGIHCEQKGEHVYDVFDHMLHALQQASDKDWPLHIRLAALFHDIGKPKTRRWDGSKAGGKGKYTFYGHEVVGARMAKKIMERLKYPKHISELVTKLVRFHMFFSDTETITLSAVRRQIQNVGKEYIWDLMKVRECDRVGMKKKEAPYRLRKYHAMIEEALRDPITVGMLKIDGTRLIEMGEKPGPKFSLTLHALLEEVLEDPLKNTVEYLEKRAHELLKLEPEELKKLGDAGKGKKDELEEEEIEKLRQKHGVK